jgi:hypothetical protein
MKQQLKTHITSPPQDLTLNRGSVALEPSLASRSSVSSANDYSATIFSSSKTILELGIAARLLAEQDDPMLTPEFFLASLSVGWRPKVVCVYSPRGVVGILYAKERVIWGIPTGIVYADGSLSGALVANPLHKQNALRVAIETLLTSPGIRGVRLRVPQHSLELDAAREMNEFRSPNARYESSEYHDSPVWKHHAHLPLADTYDRFLDGLGSKTRRNFRHYRRRFETSGHKFIERLSMDELRSATLDLIPKSEFTSGWQQLDFEAPLVTVAAANRPLAIGLKHQNGEWLGVLGGWFTPNGAVLRIQLNNERDFGSDSLSLVLRGFLIELLINQGLRELVIWSDTGPPLSRYVSYVPTVGIRFDVPKYTWRIAGWFVSAVLPILPRRLAAAAQWVVA